MQRLTNESLMCQSWLSHAILFGDGLPLATRDVPRIIGIHAACVS